MHVFVLLYTEEGYKFSYNIYLEVMLGNIKVARDEILIHKIKSIFKMLEKK